jgi:hypothetical protein
MNLQRHLTPELANEILNHPKVRPYVADTVDGYIDVSAQVANRDNYFLLGEYGGVGFLKLMNGIYEAHSFFLPEGRGEWGNLFRKQAVSWMFTSTDAIELSTRVPVEHGPARHAALSVGGQYEATHEGGCRFAGKLQDVDIYTISIQRWASIYDDLVPLGQRIHDRMLEEAKRLKIDVPPHGELKGHNRYVGVCYLMAMRGQLRKGVAFYNRFAIMSRHRTIQFVSENPPLIRFDIGLLRLKQDGDLEVIREN